MGKSKRARAAAKAAKRIPIAGTAVVVAPVASAATAAGLNMSTIGNSATWKEFLRQLTFVWTGTDPSGTGGVDSLRLTQTYAPIAAYLIARRFAGKHISRVLRPLGLRF